MKTAGKLNMGSFAMLCHCGGELASPRGKPGELSVNSNSSDKSRAPYAACLGGQNRFGDAESLLECAILICGNSTRGRVGQRIRKEGIGRCCWVDEEDR